MKKTGLIIVIIICVAVFIGSTAAAFFLAARTIGWASLQDWTRLRQRISELADSMQLPDFFPGSRQSYTIDELRSADLAGISEIRITAVSEPILLETSGSEVSARISGRYISWSRPLEWNMTRQGSRLLIYADYPRLGMLQNNLSIHVQIPAAYAGLVSVTSVSGNCRLPGEPDRAWSLFQFGSTSGKLKVDQADFAELRFKSVSGDIEIGACVARTSGETVSGKIKINFARFLGASLKTVSGKVSLEIPKDADVALSYASVSGSFKSGDLPITVTSSQKRHLTGRLNGADFPLSVNSVSGDLVMGSP